MDLYRRLSKCAETSEVLEIFGEIEDRFGRADVYTKQFIDVMMIKVLATKLGLRVISSMDENILITLANGDKVRLKAQTRDDDDVISEILIYLRRELKNANLR